MATYDQEGNPIPEDKAIYQTADPDIVKMKLNPGQRAPEYVTAEATINGQRWGFFPTPDAYALGKVFAAWDSVASIPAQIEQQLTDAAKQVKGHLSGIGLWVLLGLGAFVAIEVYSRMKRK